MVLDQAPVGLALTTMEGTWVWVNQHWCDLLGAPRDVLQGSPCFEWIVSADRVTCRAQFAQLQAGGLAACADVIRFRCADGSLMWIRVISSLVHAATGTPQHALHILEPLPPCPSHSAEATPLLTSSDLNQSTRPALASTVPGGAEVRVEGERTADRQRVIPPNPLTEQQQGQRVLRTLQGLLSRAEALVPVLEAERMSAEPLVVSAALGQRPAEVTQTVLDGQRVDIAQVEHETRVLRPLTAVGFAPREAEQWWADWRREPFENVHLVEPALLEQVQDHEVLIEEAGVPPFRERPNPSGIRQWLFAPLRLDRRLAGALGVDDGGAERTYQPEEVALVKALAHLGALLLERERLLEEREEALAHVLVLREANQRLDTFLGLAGHELKTPLAVLSLQVQVAQQRLQQALAQGGLEPTEQGERLRAVAANLGHTGAQLARMDRLVGELLDTSRIQAGRLDLQVQPLDVLALVQEVVEEQRQLDPTRHLAVPVAPRAEVWVRADADRLRQVVTNYLTNALKYSPETAPVLVGVEREATEVRVWVRDQGPGLSREQQEQIWERFYQVPVSAGQHGSGVGLGLGLYLCRALIERHGGFVGVQSRPGAGSTFWFTLPLEQEHARI